MPWTHKFGAIVYQVREDRPGAPIVERWAPEGRKKGRWVEVDPRLSAYLEVLTIYERLKREVPAENQS